VAGRIQKKERIGIINIYASFSPPYILTEFSPAANIPDSVLLAERTKAVLVLIQSEKPICAQMS